MISVNYKFNTTPTCMCMENRVVLITPEKPKIWRNLQVLNKHFPLSEFDLMQLGIFDRIFNIIVATPWPGVWGLVRVTSQLTPSNCQNSIDFWQVQGTWIDASLYENITTEIWFQGQRRRNRINWRSRSSSGTTKMNLNSHSPSLWTESAVSSMISWTLLENIVEKS